MTDMARRNSSRNRSGTLSFLTPLLLILLCATLSVMFAKRISHSVQSALLLLSNVIIPSVFPFMILSDLLYAYLDFSSLKRINKAFHRLFGTNPLGLYPFVLGALCGFPLGVKCVRDIYVSGGRTKKEAELLIGFCNNTGPAFLIAGVGAGLRKSTADGIILYVSMLLSAICVGVIFAHRAPGEYCKQHIKPEYKYSLTASIKNAGLATLNVCSYLTFFACVVGILRGFIGESYPYLALIPFIEIGSASSILSKTLLLPKDISLLMTAFATGFSGISVHLQALSHLSGCDLSHKKYFMMKLMQGLICTLICFLINATVSLIKSSFMI